MSRYEKRFGTERRQRGRPVGSEVVFRMAGKNKALAKAARQRAVALIIDDNRDRMRQLFEDEYAWLEIRARRDPFYVPSSRTKGRRLGQARRRAA